MSARSYALNTICTQFYFHYSIEIDFIQIDDTISSSFYRVSMHLRAIGAKVKTESECMLGTKMNYITATIPIPLTFPGPDIGGPPKRR